MASLPAPPGSEHLAAGFRLLLAAVCCEKGDVEANLAVHRRVLRQAADEGCHLAVFPEMSLTGSLDPRTQSDLLVTCDSALVAALVDATQEYAVGAVFGIAEHGDAGAAHITQLYACNGRLLGVYRKRHLGEGEEAFTPGAEASVWRYGALSIGIAVCAESGVDYPFDEAAAAGAQVVLLCAAPGLYARCSDEDSWRAAHAWWEARGLGDARRHAARAATWVALATQAGSAGGEDFPGLAALVDPSGAVVSRLPDWREGTLAVDLPLAVEVEPVREAARVLLLDAEGNVLLVRFADTASTPGGPPRVAVSNPVRITSRPLVGSSARSWVGTTSSSGRRSAGVCTPSASTTVRG